MRLSRRRTAGIQKVGILGSRLSRALVSALIPALLLGFLPIGPFGIERAEAATGDGSGAMTVNNASVATGSNGTFQFTFTAGASTITQVELTIPVGWTAPTSLNTSTSKPTGATKCATVGAPSFSGQVITVAVTCTVSEPFYINYGLGNTVQAPATSGAYPFDTRSKSNAADAALSSLLLGSPSVTVTTPTASISAGPSPSLVGPSTSASSFTWNAVDDNPASYSIKVGGTSCSDATGLSTEVDPVF